MLLTLVAWIALGFVIGYVTTLVVDLRGDDPRLALGVAAGAALLGGLGYVLATGTPVRLANYWAHGIAALAAVIAMIVFHILRHRQPYDRPTVRRSY